MIERHEGMTLEEYASITAGGTHEYAVNNSWGVYDYYKYYRHNRPKDKSYYKMNEYQYYKLIRTVNEYIIDLLFKNAMVVLPNGFGELAIYKNKAEVSIKDGKVRTTRPVNWNETIKLWFEDSEAEKNKTLVRWDIENILSIKYKKTTAVFNNKSFYDLQIIRRIKKRLSDMYKESMFDTPFFVDYTVDNITNLYHG